MQKSDKRIEYANMKKNYMADLYSSRGIACQRLEKKAFKRHFLTQDLGGILHKIGLIEKISVFFSF